MILWAHNSFESLKSHSIRLQHSMRFLALMKVGNKELGSWVRHLGLCIPHYIGCSNIWCLTYLKRTLLPGVLLLCFIISCMLKLSTVESSWPQWLQLHIHRFTNEESSWLSSGSQLNGNVEKETWALRGICFHLRFGIRQWSSGQDHIFMS